MCRVDRDDGRKGKKGLEDRRCNNVVVARESKPHTDSRRAVADRLALCLPRVQRGGCTRRVDTGQMTGRVASEGVMVEEVGDTRCEGGEKADGSRKP